ncbi:Putative Developmental regulator medusa [Rhizopus microsporus]|nr:Putative Developmental regulator medusa [Rhizopus microsporus]
MMETNSSTQPPPPAYQQSAPGKTYYQPPPGPPPENTQYAPPTQPPPQHGPAIGQRVASEEFSNHRRLVMFTRATEHTGIVCDFEPVSQNQISKKDAIIVSCIRWPDEGSYWITSVDCINLAEFLVGRPFSVDYKNCIRRNLEGFGPTTVSKTKPESQEFFRLIMAFSNPKPRNIEKDIKVFQWHVLPFALKKIIIKYNTEQP